VIGIVLLLFDFMGLCLAAPVSAHVCTHWLAPLHVTARTGIDFEHAALAAALMAPFILFFGSAVSHGKNPLLVHHHALRFALFAGVVLALGAAIQILPSFPRGWLVIWFATGLLLTSFARILTGRYLGRLQRRGVLTEVIAVVGAGPVTDRLIGALRHTGPHAVELLGVFDDRFGRAAGCTTQPIGSVARLLELGKTQKIDWILLTLPPTAEDRLSSVVQRLKSLSAPIALCPPHADLALPDHAGGDLHGGVLVRALTDRQIKRWGALIRAAEAFLPRWMITLALLPLAAAEAFAGRLVRYVAAVTQRRVAR
jgi:FlaA1/EpsC-like NDP-sugar epimerase